MIVGIPKEIKANEGRVALTPSGASELYVRGHQVMVESGAGVYSGFEDDQYTSAGATLVEGPSTIWREAELVIKVKEPQPVEIRQMHAGQIVFTYFHFAASRSLTEGMLQSGTIAIAYEMVQLPDRSLPLLVPMSEVAGRMAVQEAAKYLERNLGGRGVLMGGIPGVKPASVLILGAGIVGVNAAKVAAGMGAQVTIMDINLARLRYLDDVMPRNVTLLMASEATLREILPEADVLIGAVLIPGAKAPKLVTRDMLGLMKKGCVAVDVCVDQGGCFDTTRPTTHDDPTYVVDGVIHYCVANMPGAVSRTSTLGLTNATLPYVRLLADKGWMEACRQNPALAKGLSIVSGELTCQEVGEAFDLPFKPAADILNHSVPV